MFASAEKKILVPMESYYSIGNCFYRQCTQGGTEKKIHVK